MPELKSWAEIEADPQYPKLTPEQQSQQKQSWLLAFRDVAKAQDPKWDDRKITEDPKVLEWIGAPLKVDVSSDLQALQREQAVMTGIRENVRHEGSAQPFVSPGATLADINNQRVAQGLLPTGSTAFNPYTSPGEAVAQPFQGPFMTAAARVLARKPASPMDAIQSQDASVTTADVEDLRQSWEEQMRASRENLSALGSTGQAASGMLEFVGKFAAANAILPGSGLATHVASGIAVAFENATERVDKKIVAGEVKPEDAATEVAKEAAPEAAANTAMILGGTAGKSLGPKILPMLEKGFSQALGMGAGAATGAVGAELGTTGTVSPEGLAGAATLLALPFAGKAATSAVKAAPEAVGLKLPGVAEAQATAAGVRPVGEMIAQEQGQRAAIQANRESAKAPLVAEIKSQRQAEATKAKEEQAAQQAQAEAEELARLRPEALNNLEKDLSIAQIKKLTSAEIDAYTAGEATPAALARIADERIRTQNMRVKPGEEVMSSEGQVEPNLIPVKPSEGVIPNAENVRSDAGLVQKPRVEPGGGKAKSGNDLQQQTEVKPEAGKVIEQAPQGKMTDLSLTFGAASGSPKTLVLTRTPQAFKEFMTRVANSWMWGERSGGKTEVESGFSDDLANAERADRYGIGQSSKRLKSTYGVLFKEAEAAGPEFAKDAMKYLNNEIDLSSVNVGSAKDPAKLLGRLEDLRDEISTRSLKAARLAEETGNPELAKAIRSHVGDYTVRQYKARIGGKYEPGEAVSRDMYLELEQNLDKKLAKASRAIEKIASPPSNPQPKTVQDLVTSYAMTGDKTLLSSAPPEAAKRMVRAKRVVDIIQAGLGEHGRVVKTPTGVDIDIPDPILKERIIKGQMAEILKHETFSSMVAKEASAAWKLFRGDLAKRKDLTPVMRKFLGEIDDIHANVLATEIKQKSLIRKLEFQKQLFEHNQSLPPTEKIISTINQGDKTVKLSGPGFGPLTQWGKQDVYVNRATAEMLQGMDSQLEHFGKYWASLNGFLRYSRTGANFPAHQERNGLGMGIFMLPGGEPIAYPARFAKATARALRTYFSDPVKYEEYLRSGAIKGSALNADARADMGRAYGDESLLAVTDGLSALGKARRILMKFGNAANDFFENVPRLADYLSRESRGVPHEKIVKDLDRIYPTPGKAPTAVSHYARQLPFIKDFPTFMAETLRTDVNAITDAGKMAMKAAQTNDMALAREATGRLLGLGLANLLATGAGTFLAGNLAALGLKAAGYNATGMTKDEEKYVRFLLPEYQELGAFVMFKNEEGKPVLGDFSYIQPYDYKTKLYLAGSQSDLPALKRAEVAARGVTDWFGWNMASQFMAGMVTGTDLRTHQPKDRLDIAFETIAPTNFRALNEMRRLAEAEGPLLTSSGEERTMAGEAGRAVTPTRLKVADPVFMFKQRMLDTKRTLGEITAPADKAYRNWKYGKGPESDYQNAKIVAEKQLNDWFSIRVRRRFEGARGMQVSEGEIRAAIKNAKFSQDDVKQMKRVVAGEKFEYVPPQMHR